MLNNIAMVKTADFDVSWILFLSWGWQNSLFLNVMYQNILFLINFTGWKSFNLLSNYTLQLYWQFFFHVFLLLHQLVFIWPPFSSDACWRNRNSWSVKIVPESNRLEWCRIQYLSIVRCFIELSVAEII